MKKVVFAGSLVIDIINEKADRLPDEGEAIGAPVTLNLGGNAYSAPVNLARLKPEGVEIFTCGAVGKDHPGEMFERAFRTEGVSPNLQKSSSGTSCNMILQEKGKDRRYIFSQGANLDFSKEAFLDFVHNVQPDLVCFGELPCINLTGDRFQEVVEACQSAKDCLIYLDLLVHSHEFYDWMGEGWKRVDILHCNLGEAAHVTKAETVSEMIGWFIDQGVGVAIVTDGENGCYLGLKEDVIHIPAFPVMEVDATGAGDATTAGVICQLLERFGERKIDLQEISREQWDEILRFASACGAVAVGEVGCIGHISRERVEALMRI